MKSKKIIIIFSILLIIILIGGYFAIKYVKEKQGENTKSEEVLSEIAVNRGFKLKGNELDLKRAADILIDEFRAAKLGRMTLESVENVLED